MDGVLLWAGVGGCLLFVLWSERAKLLALVPKREQSEPVPTGPSRGDAFRAADLLVEYFDGIACDEGRKAAKEAGACLFHAHERSDTA